MMTLTGWVKKQGGFKGAGKILKVSPHCVNAWVRGRALPRPTVMQRIVKLTKGQVTYDAMINENRGRRQKSYALARKKRIAKTGKPKAKSKAKSSAKPKSKAAK